MREVVLASTRWVSRSAALRRDPLSDHPADRQPAEREGLHAERIGDRQRIAAELLDAVLAGRRIARAVPAQVVAQHLEMPLEIRGLRIPHAVVEPERMRQHHDRTPCRRRSGGNSDEHRQRDNEGHGRSTLPDRSSSQRPQRLGGAEIALRAIDAVEQIAGGTAVSPATPAARRRTAAATPAALRDGLARPAAARCRGRATAPAASPRARRKMVPPVASRFAPHPLPDRRSRPSIGVGQRAHRRSRRLHGRADDRPLGLAAAGAPLVLLRSSRSGTRQRAPASASPPPAPPRIPTGSASAASSTIRRPVRRLRRLRPASAG